MFWYTEQNLQQWEELGVQDITYLVRGALRGCGTSSQAENMHITN